MKTMMKALFFALTVTAAACGGDSSADDDDTPTHDAGAVVDGGAPDASCFENPATHLEIINACTDAEKIDKDPELPLLNPDGTLPDLP